MANSVARNSTLLIGYGLIAKTSNSHGRRGSFSSISSPGSFRVRAVQDNEGPRRLVDIIRNTPEVSRNYFRSPSRRAFFGGIYLSLYLLKIPYNSRGNVPIEIRTFDILVSRKVNDVIAQCYVFLITEYVTRFYHRRPKVTFPIALLNNFKMGFTYGLFIDAFKLAS